MKTLKLPLNDAIKASVKQNIERDRRMEKDWGLDIDDGPPMPDPLSQDELDIYYDEAKHLLETTGENYLPDYPDHFHIVVKS